MKQQMAKYLKVTFGLMAISAFLTSCGENYRATYTGDVIISPKNCPAPGGEYTAEIAAEIADTSVGMEITNLIPKTGAVTEPIYLFKKWSRFKGGVKDYQDFSVSSRASEQLQGGQQVSVTASGTIDKDRSQIYNLRVDFFYPIDATSGGGLCEMVLNTKTPLMLKE